MQERVSFELEYDTGVKNGEGTKFYCRVKAICRSIELNRSTLQLATYDQRDWQTNGDTFSVTIHKDDQTFLRSDAFTLGIGDGSDPHITDWTLVRELNQDEDTNVKKYINCIDEAFKSKGFQRVMSNKMNCKFYVYVRDSE